MYCPLCDEIDYLLDILYVIVLKWLYDLTFCKEKDSLIMILNKKKWNIS